MVRAFLRPRAAGRGANRGLPGRVPVPARRRRHHRQRPPAPAHADRAPARGARRHGALFVVPVIGREPRLAVAMDSNGAWQALTRAIERDDLAANGALATLPAGRKAHENEIEAAIGAWAAARDPREAGVVLQRAGVAASAVIPTHELLRRPAATGLRLLGPAIPPLVEDHFAPRRRSATTASARRWSGPRPRFGQTQRRGPRRAGDRARGRLARRARRTPVGGRLDGARPRSRETSAGRARRKRCAPPAPDG